MEGTTLIGGDNTDLLDLSGGDSGEGGKYKRHIEGSAKANWGGEGVPLEVVPLATGGGPSMQTVGTPVVVTRSARRPFGETYRMPRWSMAGAILLVCPMASSRVILETKSSTLVSISRSGLQ